jgi:hypothetical protein
MGLGAGVGTGFGGQGLILVMHVSSAPLTSLCWLTTVLSARHLCLFVYLLPLSLHLTFISHHLYDTLELNWTLSNAITLYWAYG